jgi:hypothetical protein
LKDVLVSENTVGHFFIVPGVQGVGKSTRGDKIITKAVEILTGGKQE